MSEHMQNLSREIDTTKQKQLQTLELIVSDE